MPTLTYPTPAEKKSLEQLAALAGLSYSRYLIECGLAGAALAGRTSLKESL